jgi:hypothetical protein
MSDKFKKLKEFIEDEPFDFNGEYQINIGDNTHLYLQVLVCEDDRVCITSMHTINFSNTTKNVREDIEFNVPFTLTGLMRMGQLFNTFATYVEENPQQ